MRDFYVLPSHQVLYDFGAGRPVKAPTIFGTVQGEQFRYSTAHGIVVLYGPNSSREQSLASLTTAVRFVDV
jgi:hypothetical protein